MSNESIILFTSKMKKFSLLLIILIGATNLTSAYAASSSPKPQKSIFILDASGSTDSSSLWTNNLRPSLMKKLARPIGTYNNKPLKEAQSVGYSDISITLINSNSQLAPIIEIITKQDTDNIWGMLKKVGENPSTSRLSELWKGFFDDGGVYPKLATIYYLNQVKPSIDKNSCMSSAILEMKSGNSFIANLDNGKKKTAADALCTLTIKIAGSLAKADKTFADPNLTRCQGYCSDVIGAILQANALADDTYLLDKNVNFCIAIASDMLNNFPGMSSSSPLNALYVANNAATLADARKKGAEAAVLSTVRFYSSMDIKVSVIGQGVTNGSQTFKLDRAAFLKSYWDGFWNQAGIKSYALTRSLNQACSLGS